MGGALSIDKDHKKPNISWWEGEAITKDDMENAFKNLDEGGNIDIVVSHTCPESFIETFAMSYPNRVIRKLDDENPAKLDKILKYLLAYRRKPKYWFFGHWHIDYDFKIFGIKAYAIYDYALKLTESNRVMACNYSLWMRTLRSERGY